MRLSNNLAIFPRYDTGKNIQSARNSFKATTYPLTMRANIFEDQEAVVCTISHKQSKPGTESREKCSTFMQNYIQKLKKQRKKQYKLQRLRRRSPSPILTEQPPRIIMFGNMATTKGFTKKMMGCSPSEQAIKNECIRNIISSVKHSNRSSRNKQSPNGRVDQLPPLFSEGKQGVSSRLDSYNFKLLQPWENQSIALDCVMLPPAVK